MTRFAAGSGSACPGSAGPAASAATAAAAARTSATRRASPATTSTAASPSTRSRTSATASRSPSGYPDVAGRAAALRRADRLARATRWPATRERLGLYGFGAAAHIVCQVARWQGRRVFAFTRAGRRARARRSHASSARSGRAARTSAPPEELDAAIVFAPAGELVPAALAASAKGGSRRLRRNPHERHPVVPLRAAVGRARHPVGGEPDAARRRGVHALAPAVPMHTEVTVFPLAEAGDGARAAPLGRRPRRRRGLRQRARLRGRRRVSP